MRVGVLELPLACCAMESAVAIAELPRQIAGVEVERFQPDTDYDLRVLLIAGTVTKAGAAALQAAWEQLAEPRAAVAFGVCASSGGPYWDAPTVLPGAAELVPVARFVPGCPPPAAAVLDAVLAVANGD